MIDNAMKQSIQQQAMVLYQQSLDKLPGHLRNIRIIFMSISGSHLYGTSRKDSDIDLRGAAIPPIEYFYGFKSFEQFEDKENDVVIWDIRKFINLLAKCNPNFIELLFVPDDMTLVSSLAWKNIVHNRDLFITKLARNTFAGYALSQLKRIKTHRGYLINKPVTKPLRQDYDISANPRLNTEQMSALMQLPDTIISPAHKTMAENEKMYHDDLQRWKQYDEWKRNRNPKRAKMEAKMGFDGKHASHLVRLIEMGKELLATGHITLPMQGNALQEVKDVMAGKYSYFELTEKIVGDIGKQFDKMSEVSSLPDKPDMDVINELCVDIVNDALERCR